MMLEHRVPFLMRGVDGEQSVKTNRVRNGVTNGHYSNGEIKNVGEERVLTPSGVIEAAADAHFSPPKRQKVSEAVNL